MAGDAQRDIGFGRRLKYRSSNFGRRKWADRRNFGQLLFVHIQPRHLGEISVNNG